MPWGNSIEDAADLAVLMDYYVEMEVLIAHWKLDDAEGITAHDSTGDNHGTLIGDPIWRPAAGQFDGAPELDGVDDGVETDFVFDPAYGGPFSVFAWVKGGGPGQVIISQANGRNWLTADPFDGSFGTELYKAPPSCGFALYSETPIVDGQWHHVGLVRDAAGTRTTSVPHPVQSFVHPAGRT